MTKRTFAFLAICLGLSAQIACSNNETNNGQNNDNNNPYNNQKLDMAPDLSGDMDEDMPPETQSVALAFEEIDLGEEITAMTEIKFIPNRDEFLLLRKNGQVLHFEITDNKAKRLGDFTLADVDDSSDCGLISVAFDPDFETNKFVYFGYCKALGVNVITRHELHFDDLSKVATTQKNIITVRADDALKAWHNVGSIEFDQEKTMWTVFGENALQEPAQDPNNPLGAVVRIIPNRDPDGEGHEPAPNNPYAQTGDPVVYSVGLRSPWRARMDQVGRLWIGDVGAATTEEVNVLTPGKHNFGWPKHEGPCKENCDGFTDPVVSWNRKDDHPFVLEDDDTEPTTRRAVWVGIGQRPPATNDPYEGRLSDKMIYGDFCAGWVRAMALNEDKRIVYDKSIAHLAGVVSWDQAKDGHLYVITYGNCFTFPYKPGKLYRAVLKK